MIPKVPTNRSELVRLLKQGEGRTLEFKRSTGELREGMQTLCAFLFKARMVAGGATPQVTPQVAQQVSPQVEAVLETARQAASAEALQKYRSTSAGERVLREWTGRN